MTDIAVWYKSLPFFTKYWLTLTVGISLIARFGLISNFWLFLDSEFVFRKFQVSDFDQKKPSAKVHLYRCQFGICLIVLFVGCYLQIWRLVTCVFFYPINPATGFHFMLNCYFLYNYSLRLENDHFKGSPADYCFLLIFNWLCCIIVGLLFDLQVINSIFN